MSPQETADAARDRVEVARKALSEAVLSDGHYDGEKLMDEHLRALVAHKAAIYDLTGLEGAELDLARRVHLDEGRG